MQPSWPPTWDSSATHSTTQRDAFISSELHDMVTADESMMQHWICLMLATDLRKPIIGETKSTSSMRTVPVPTAVRHIAARYIFCADVWVRPLPHHCCHHTYPDHVRIMLRNHFIPFAEKEKIL